MATYLRKKTSRKLYLLSYVLLYLQRKITVIPSCAQFHAFILRWLTATYKQKRFSRGIVPDTEGLLTMGRNKGLAASLLNRLEYLWSSCTGSVPTQSDLYRLTYALERLKLQGRVNTVVSDEYWDNEALLVQEYSDTDALLVRKSALKGGFSDEGKLVAPVEFLLTGNLSACMAVFQACALPAVVLKPDRIAIQP